MRSRAQLLSAALIVRDEEEHLGPCLESLRGVVDEVVVVDTGSSDDTVAVARAHGAQVFVDEWADDFSRARNAALDRVSGRWVLYVDADERLQPISREAVVDLLEPAEEIAFRVLLHPFVGATPSREFRLWRNHDGIRFEGIIHEKVIPAIHAVAAAEGRGIGICDLTLDHLGYERDQARKHVRNLPLLRAQLAVEPRNVFNWRHLAAVLGALGETDAAERALKRAVDLVRDADAPSGGSLAYADLVLLHPSGGGGERLMDEALDTYPRDPLLLWMKAVMELDAGRTRSALRWLDRLDAIDRTTLDDTISYDARLFGSYVHEARGVALFRLRRYRDAARAFGRAETFEPDNPVHRAKRLMAEHLSVSPRSGSSTRVVDLAGIATRVRASDAKRTQVVDAVVAGLAPHGGTALFDISVGPEPVVTPDRKHDHADGDIRAWWNGDDLYLTHGRCAVHADATRARVSGDADLGRAFRQLFPYIATHLLAPRDLFVLHGGAVQRDDRAVLVLGGTGSGKSTTVVSALWSGWTALADDLVVVRLGAHGPEVLGIPKPLVAPFDVVGKLGLPARPIKRDRRGRWQMQVEVEWSSWVPITSTIVSSHAETRDGGFTAITGTEHFKWLLHSFLARGERSRLRRYLSVAAALACEGAWELHHGSDATARVGQVAALLKHIRASDAHRQRTREPMPRSAIPLR